MRIRRLSLENFKGIKKLDVELNCKSANIFGDNATGKTTIVDAWNWLLFDKDSLNRANFEIKTLGVSGEVIHGLDHSVEVEFENGSKLKKVYKEKWTKPRGQATEVFSGHTTDYFINEVPAKKSEFTDAIKEIIDEDIFKLLSNPLYFNNQLHWQKRRELLFEVCGDVEDGEVIASDNKLKELGDILGDRALSKHKDFVKSKLTAINKELNNIPVRIDEVNKGIQEEPKQSFDELMQELSELKKTKQAKGEELSLLNNDGGAIAIRKEIADLEVKKQELLNQQRREFDNLQAQNNKMVNETRQNLNNLKIELNNQLHIISIADKNIKEKNEQAANLREKYSIESQKVFKPHDIKDVCPVCEQKLPDEKISDAVNKAFDNFNKEKSEVLTNINNHGKSLVKEIEEEAKKLNDAESKKIELESQIKSTEQTLNEATEQTKDITLKPCPEAEELEKKIENLRNQKQDPMLGAQKDRIRENISEIEGFIKEIDAKLNIFEKNKASNERVNELMIEQEKLADEHRKYSKEMFLCDEFIRVKTNMIETKINNKFKLAKFKLFDTQVNGGLQEVCEVVVDGVPYSDLNNAMKTNAGLDVIATLQKHFKTEVPVFVDNAESVTKLQDLDAQLIRLVVSEQDKKLRIEVD